MADRESVLKGVVASLAVAVLGGIAVEYAKSAFPTPREDLVVSRVSPATFAGQGGRLNIAGATIRNAGSLPAENVRIVVGFGAAAVKDSDIKFSSGKAATYSDLSMLGDSTDLAVPFLAPGESVQMAYLVEGDPLKDAEISVKSKNSVGRELSETSEDFRGKLTTAALSGVFGTLALGTLGWALLRGTRAVYDIFSDRNDTAFVLLHRGLHKEAYALLDNGIAKDGGTPYMLANFGVCVALSGDPDRGRRMIEAARFLAHGQHTHAVIDFCECLILMKASKELQKAADLGSSALRRSGAVKRYIRNSIVVQELMAISPEHDAVFRRHL